MKRPARTRLEIREVEPGDVDALLADLRPADRAECDALIGPGKERATLLQSLDRSVFSRTGTINGQVLCMFGLAPMSLLGEQGLPWMLGTSLVDRHAGAFIRENRPYIARMLRICPQLVNVVDARNVKSIVWLKKMGFAILPAQPMGRAGLPFHPFVLNA